MPYYDYPFLGETARFEWALQTAFDATDTELVDIDAVTQIPPQAWPEMCPVVHDSVQRLRFALNTVDFWRAVQAEQDPPQPGALQSPVDWLIWRQGLQPHFRSLEVDEAWAADAVLTGQSFGEICEGLCEWIDPEQVGIRAASFLKRWVTDGVVTALRAG